MKEKYFFYRSKNYYVCYVSEQEISTEEDADVFMNESIYFGLGLDKQSAKSCLDINVSGYNSITKH